MNEINSNPKNLLIQGIYTKNEDLIYRSIKNGLSIQDIIDIMDNYFPTYAINNEQILLLTATKIIVTIRECSSYSLLEDLQIFYGAFCKEIIGYHGHGSEIHTQISPTGGYHGHGSEIHAQISPTRGYHEMGYSDYDSCKWNELINYDIIDIVYCTITNCHNTKIFDGYIKRVYNYHYNSQYIYTNVLTLIFQKISSIMDKTEIDNLPTKGKIFTDLVFINFIYTYLLNTFYKLIDLPDHILYPDKILYVIHETSNPLYIKLNEIAQILVSPISGNDAEMNRIFDFSPDLYISVFESTYQISLIVQKILKEYPIYYVENCVNTIDTDNTFKIDKKIVIENIVFYFLLDINLDDYIVPD